MLSSPVDFADFTRAGLKLTKLARQQKHWHSGAPLDWPKLRLGLEALVTQSRVTPYLRFDVVTRVQAPGWALQAKPENDPSF